VTELIALTDLILNATVGEVSRQTLPASYSERASIPISDHARAFFHRALTIGPHAMVKKPKNNIMTTKPMKA